MALQNNFKQILRFQNELQTSMNSFFWTTNIARLHKHEYLVEIFLKGLNKRRIYISLDSMIINNN